MIPAEAVEAAVEALRTPAPPYKAEGVLTWEKIALTVLEAAAPYLLAPITRLADEWHEQGEELMADSKTIQDEYISVELLKEGATMVENARHIRNAIAGNS